VVESVFQMVLEVNRRVLGQMVMDHQECRSGPMVSVVQLEPEVNRLGLGPMDQQDQRRWFLKL
jgi:hypothetical protein